MDKKFKISLFLLAIFTIALSGCTTPIQKQTDLNRNTNSDYPIYTCPEDLKICPNGGSVGRGGPNCEFGPCPGDNQPVVGGDADEHGCIGSAGYIWCEDKNKCLRSWEEECPSLARQQIRSALAKKYSKPLSEVIVTISRSDDEHAVGSIRFGKEPGTEGGLFLAVKVDGVFELVYDGNGSIDCEKMRKVYGFSDELLKPNFCD